MILSEKMQALVVEYRRSGLTQKEFCLESGMSVAKLNYWISKSKSEKMSGGFIPLNPAAIHPELTIEYPNGVKIAAGTSDLSLVARLVKLY